MWHLQPIVLDYLVIEEENVKVYCSRSFVYKFDSVQGGFDPLKLIEQLDGL